MSSYCIGASFTGRLWLSIEANSKDEAKEAFLKSIYIDAVEDIQSDFVNNISEIHQVEYRFIDKAATGNVQERFVFDMTIELNNE